MKVWAIPLCSPLPPIHSLPFSALLFLLSRITVPLAFQLPVVVTQWGVLAGEWGRKEEWGWGLCFPGSLPAILLPDDCVPWPKVHSPRWLQVLVLLPLASLYLGGVAAPTAASPAAALSYVVSPFPTNTFVNSPFIKFPSNYLIWVHHLLLARLWLIQDYL